MAPAPDTDAGAADTMHPRGPDRRAGRSPPSAPEGALATVAGLSPGMLPLHDLLRARPHRWRSRHSIRRQVPIPLALGTLLAFTLQPLVTRLRRLAWAGGGLVAIVTSLATALLLGFLFVTGSQVVTLANNLPSYKSNLEEKIRYLKSSAASGSALDKASTALRDLNRQINAAGPADPPLVSRYLALQVLVGTSDGVPIGIGLYLIGVPNAVLWGVLAAVLRFIPYIGPVIAALFPAVMAVAVDPGWSMLGWTLALFAVSEVVNNNVVKPLLYTSSTGMSAIAMIAAAVFWTMLWGPAGLFLATPLTVCLVVLGRYVPQLHFLYLLLGNAPALTPPERFEVPTCGAHRRSRARARAAGRGR